MAIVPIRIDRTSKPPLGTPLRSDGHWSVQGLVFPWAFNEGAGSSAIGGASRIDLNPQCTYAGGLLSCNNDYGVGPVLAPTPDANKSTLIVGCSFGDVNRQQYAASQGGSACELGVFGGKAILLFLSGTDYVQSTDNLVNNRHYVLAAVRGDDYARKLYVDGTLNAIGRANGNDNYTSPMYAGRTALGPGYNLIGNINFLYLYYRGLSSSEISSLSANPWVIYDPETVWVEVGGGGEQSLFAGSIYGQSSVSAQLSTAITIASQVVAAGSITGGINTAIRLATSTQGDSSVSALLTTAIRMAASAQGYGSATADLSTVIALAADILAASSASGALSTAIRFGGALSGSSTTTAALTNAIAMAAQAVGLGSISGQLAGTVAAALFSGTISGSSSASANLSTAIVLAAAAQGSSTAQAALSTALELAAQVNGFGSATGELSTDISGLAGSLHGSSEAQATLSTAIHLMGLAAGQCVVSGRLAEPVEILAQLRVMASDPLALTISVRDPLALRVTVQ